MIPPETIAFEVNCTTGAMAEVVLDDSEVAALRAARTVGARQTAAEIRRQTALAGLRVKAVTDETVRELLIVLGLE